MMPWFISVRFPNVENCHSSVVLMFFNIRMEGFNQNLGESGNNLEESFDIMGVSLLGMGESLQNM